MTASTSDIDVIASFHDEIVTYYAECIHADGPGVRDQIKEAEFSVLSDWSIDVRP